MPTVVTKSDRIVDLLRRRIHQGDYAHRALPTEVALAEEVGVSRMTARKVLLRLVDAGVLRREPHGRVTVNHARRQATRRLQIALLKPAYEAGGSEQWRAAAERAGEQLTDRKVTIRPVDYVHWDDPVLLEVLEPAHGGDRDTRSSGYDGILLLPAAETVRSRFTARLRATRIPLVMLGRELTEHGLFGVDPCPPDQFRRLLDHLRDLGHRRIDLINTQPHTPGLTVRIELWQTWRDEHTIVGERFDRPVESYDNTMIAGYDLARELLDAGRLGPAVFCTTTTAALGVMRAVHEKGLRIGRDISVCGADDEGFARFTVPSITTLTPIDPQAELTRILGWMAEGGRPADWPGGPNPADRLITTDRVPLFAGESTGPAPDAAMLTPGSQSSARPVDRAQRHKPRPNSRRTAPSNPRPA